MIRFSSFSAPIRAMVVGSAGAIGSALVEHLAGSDDVERVIACQRDLTPTHHRKITPCRIDMLDESSIVAALSGIDRIDLVIVATGRLHSAGGLQPEKTWRALDAESLVESFAMNAIGPALIAKHTLPLLPIQGRAVFAALSARVGSISENQRGGWYGYRASKAALNQIIKTLSIELRQRRRDAICIGLHPGTVDSALSRPYLGGVAAANLFAPSFAAERLLAVVDAVEPRDSGALLAWDGSRVEP